MTLIAAVVFMGLLGLTAGAVLTYLTAKEADRNR